MRFEDQRKALVGVLKYLEITDELVLAAFGEIAREDFVPAHVKELAYRNQALPIGEDQTISQPYMVALMMQELALTPDDVVLEIGTGSGYQTALLASIVTTVCTIERHESLTIGAKEALAKYQFKNIYYKVGDGTKGWVDSYPPIKKFTKIIVCAGAPKISEPLLTQLEIGGRLVIPVGDRDEQSLKTITKRETGYDVKEGTGCRFVPLIGESGWEKD